MTPKELGRISIAMESIFRENMRESLQQWHVSEDDQIHVAAAVTSLMLKRLYQQLGQQWLESIMKVVLTVDL